MTQGHGEIDERVGDVVLNRYELRKLIGRGGQGAVYEARDKQSGTLVAVKVLHDSADQDETTRQRFKREAQALRDLEGTAALHLYDFGFAGDGLVCLVMELLKGNDLDEELARMERAGKQFRPVDIPFLFSPIVNTLERAHAIGIVHRDLKPQNIMFRNADELALADFGLARDVAATSTLTQKGLVLATPLYMSPEQVLGLPHDARGDLYSLGAIVYEIIVGAPPFAGSTAPDLAYQHVHAAPPPLPGRAIGYQTLVSRLLAKKPEDRFQTAGDVLNYLERATA